ncbi:MAG TPA: TonB-dependent receptor [Candidatus Sulfotelmatobacter sp.]|nr:TonB-dependent receptor [Candidatus Sulfotelmatobacter sp.]
MNRLFCRTFIFLILIVLGSPALLAQVDRAVLEGTVKDSSGGTIAAADVKILRVATGITEEQHTNSAGYYRFPGVSVGHYTVTVSNSGFKTKVIEGVPLEVGETRTLDIALEVGVVSEKIEISASEDPPERSSAESSAVIGELQIENLPLNGRNWANLTRLAPWAQDDGGGDQRTIRFAGRGRDDNTFSYDGVDATGIQEQAQKAEVRLQISPDAIAEYRVSSALYDAEYGSQSGGQVDVVTKSGTNEYHGSVYGYFRNSDFDARNFNDFDINGNAFLPPFRMGQYGLTFGGPIVKTKAFFFLNYEGLRQYQQVTTVAAVPDPTVQQAALSGPQGANLCPIIQAYPWRQSAVSTLQTFGCTPKFVYPDTAFAYNCPDPTNCLGTGFDNFTHQGKSIIHEDTWLARFDYKFSDATTFYARAQRDVAFARSPNGNLFDQNDTNNHPANYVLALQHLFSSNLMNEFKFGVNRAPFHNPVIPGLIDISLSTANFESLNNSQTDNEVGTTYSYIDNLSWTHGRHTLKTGIEVKRVQLNQGKTESLSVSLKGGAGDNTSLILNQVSFIDYTTSWDGHALRRTFVMPYVQDEWKVTPTLTVNAGLRWDFYSPVTEAHDRVKIFDLTGCHGYCSPTSDLEFPNYKNFDPRLSLAWAPGRFNGRTVVRGGFGIYHGAAQNDDRNAALESDRSDTQFVVGQGNPPLDQSQLFFSPDYLQKPPNFNFPPGTAQPQEVARALIRHHPDLYVETWGLSIQQALPQNFLFTVSYLGSHGVHIFTRNYENLCDPAQLHPGNGTIGPCVRPLDNFPDPTTGQTFGTIDYKANNGNSSYHGLLLAIDRQITKGLSFNAKYTFSHSINDGTIGGGEAIAPQNADCLACEKGPSIYDVRHNIILASVYELPFGPGKQHFTEGIGARLLGNWTLGGLWNWHTGHPLTVTMDVSGNPDYLPDGNDGTASSQRPDLVPGVSVVPSGQNSNNWVNPAAFTTPPYDPQTGSLLRYGNAGNGLIRSPHVWQVDFTAEKGIKITERFTAQFGAQFFNIFNHTQLADPNTLSFTYGCTSGPPPLVCSITPNSNFGVINTFVNKNTNSDKFFADNTGSGLPRQIQLYVRFQF